MGHHARWSGKVKTAGGKKCTKVWLAAGAVHRALEILYGRVTAHRQEGVVVVGRVESERTG